MYDQDHYTALLSSYDSGIALSYFSNAAIRAIQMKSEVLYNTSYSYPGDYVPLLKPEEIDEELKLTNEGDMLIPPVNITEQADSFKIDVAIPGVKREDFLVHTNENVLFVRVLHKDYGPKEVQHFQLHEFNYKCFDRHITLPDNADPEFSSAEYKGGILQLVMPKTNQPVKNRHNRIVVY